MLPPPDRLRSDDDRTHRRERSPSMHVVQVWEVFEVQHGEDIQPVSAAGPSTEGRDAFWSRWEPEGNMVR